ncbi:uncharacterized protein T551_03562 [Pneumocystis jirovecii RU7]|uniref:1,3-beta-glucanosyltransferase n=1 Tax=Pneumocystis jirovecii (strain RU7) TaxID=1408657 RepID=A0A0W4ZD74_PNEJ7|nr:uncharacterized protein T551_03562 [Pneumocystis jirovecii RU7]KTW26263.1 hypothetical protein T551_03562 [Pneumocystis jirovecii RU7]
METDKHPPIRFLLWNYLNSEFADLQICKRKKNHLKAKSAYNRQLCEISSVFKDFSTKTNKFKMFFSAFLHVFLWIAVYRQVKALNPIVIVGNAFFDSITGERFYVKGVDYQPGGSSSLVDPLSNIRGCERDIPIMKELGINAIRVYQVDNSDNHDRCMKLLEENGIYLFLDINTALISLWSVNTASSYTDEYLQNIFATVDAFKKYVNVIGFFAGNEIVSSPEQSNALPWIKSVVRDLKSYIQKHSKRKIYVGYSATDINNRVPTAMYLNCGNDNHRVDFYAINLYSWCSPSNFMTSGYSQRVLDFSAYTIPIFFSEYGCNRNPPRPFDEVQYIYSREMSGVFSGGLVYEWTEELGNPNYGLVYINGRTLQKKQDFYNLKYQYEKINLPEGSGGYKVVSGGNKCPENSFSFNVYTELPKMPKSAEKYLKHGAGKPLGLRPLGSKNKYPKPENPDFPDDKDSTNSNDDDDDDSASMKHYSYKKIYFILFISLFRIYLF